jgi:hypothetical protein
MSLGITRAPRVQRSAGAGEGAAKRARILRFMGLLPVIRADDDAPGNAGAMTVTNGLYTIQIEMTEGGQGRANGVIVLHDGRIAGGDSYFYYSGSYSADRGKWRGELTTSEHTKSAGVLPLFGGRDVTCGFTGLYSADTAQVNGTALVGKTSVMFVARLMLRSKL